MGTKTMDMHSILPLDSLQSFCEKHNVLFIIKKHFYHREEKENLDDYPNITDITNVEDIDPQVLLYQSDVLITDYSSCMFDFVTVPKPCFIYAPDLEQYEHDRGNYFKMSELPFPLAQDNDELADNIKNFDMEEYANKVKELHKKVGLCETGHASEVVADTIIDFIEKAK